MENKLEYIKSNLLRCINDPMWADHAEVNKAFLQSILTELTENSVGVPDGLDFADFKGPRLNLAWNPDPQELVYIALQHLDHEGDADENAGEQIIERLLALLENTPPQGAGREAVERNAVIEECARICIELAESGEVGTLTALKCADDIIALKSSSTATAQEGDELAELTNSIEFSLKSATKGRDKTVIVPDTLDCHMLANIAARVALRRSRPSLASETQKLAETYRARWLGCLTHGEALRAVDGVAKPTTVNGGAGYEDFTAGFESAREAIKAKLLSYASPPERPLPAPKDETR